MARQFVSKQAMLTAVAFCQVLCCTTRALEAGGEDSNQLSSEKVNLKGDDAYENRIVFNALSNGGALNTRTGAQFPGDAVIDVGTGGLENPARSKRLRGGKIDGFVALAK